jgi:hypothetical protein
LLRVFFALFHQILFHLLYFKSQEMTDIDTKSKVFMTTKAAKSLFPPLNDTLSLTNSENQSKFKSSPSVVSLVAIEQQRQKIRLNEKQELLNIEEKMTKASITPAATKSSHSQLGNYEQIKKILLTLPAETTVIDANHNHPNRSDSIDSWSVLSNMEKRKTNHQKYFANICRTPSQKSTTTTTTTASITPLELVSSKSRLSEMKLKQPMEIIGKSNLAGAAKSKISEAEAIISTHHFPDWQLHLLNYKLKKGHYLKPADLNRLFNNIKRLSRFGLNQSCSTDTSSDDAFNKTTCLKNTTSNETSTNNPSNLTQITVATSLTFKSFNYDSTFTINGFESFVDGKTCLNNF